MPEQFLDIGELVRRTGLEESQIRFYESAYAALLPPKVPVGAEWRFSPQAVDAFRRVHAFCVSGQLHQLTPITDAPSPQDLHPPPQQPAPRGRILAVTSGKGGVGKSNVALNLSVLLRKNERQTLLFDADMGTGNQHILAGLPRRATLVDCLRAGAPIEQAIQPGPLGLAVIASGSGIEELADLPAEARQVFIAQLRALAAGVDALVIDTGTGIARGVIEFAALGDLLIVVTTPDITAITDAYGLIKALARRSATVPVGVVVNNAPSAALAKDVFNRLEQCAASFLSLGLRYLGPVYRDPAVPRAVGRRRPFVLDAPDARCSRSLTRVCENVMRTLDALPDRPSDPHAAGNPRGTGTLGHGNTITLSH